MRGQERRACEKAGIPFRGFPSEPLYSLKKPRGWLAAVNLVRAYGIAPEDVADVLNVMLALDVGRARRFG